MANWYPQDEDQLNKLLDKFLEGEGLKEEIHGIIVPHAGYEFSGAIAGKAYSLLKNKGIKRAIVIGPSHYKHLSGAVTTNASYGHYPLGEIQFFNSGFMATDTSQEHSIENQFPFLQKLGIKEIMPLMIGNITEEDAEEIVKIISGEDAMIIFSTDLSHFMPYLDAVKKDKRSIKIIEDLDIKKWRELDACGFYPLLVMMQLCKKNNWKPRLIEYKNSGDVIGDKKQVVGYSSFWF